MSFAAIQALLSGKTPYWMFDFARGTTRIFMTTHSEDVVTIPDAFDVLDAFEAPDAFTRTWASTPGLSRSKIPYSTEAGASTLSITFPNSNVFARQYLAPAGMGLTTVAIYKAHRSDPEQEFRIKYRGDLFQVKPGDPEITLDFGSDAILMDSKALIRVMQQNCAHSVYFGGCRLVQSEWEVAAMITAGAGTDYTVPVAALQPDTTYRAGILRWGALQEMIVKQVGSAITLSAPIPGLADWIAANGSADVYLAPGCDLTLGTCSARFGNHLNFGGFPWMSDSPFDGRSIV